MLTSEIVSTVGYSGGSTRSVLRLVRAGTGVGLVKGGEVYRGAGLGGAIEVAIDHYWKRLAV